MKIIDIGGTFGMSGHRVFRPWEPQVLVPHNFNHYLDKLKEADFVIFGGGGDIHPSLYNQQSVHAMVGHSPSHRDLFEQQAFKAAVDAKIPIFGICRGAQMLAAMNGGMLWQDVTNHSGKNHQITTNEGETYVTTSVHHQMVFVDKIEHELVAWATNVAQGYQTDPQCKRIMKWNPEREPEIVYYPQTNTLGVQGHPEFITNTDDPFVAYTRRLVEQKLLANKGA